MLWMLKIYRGLNNLKTKEAELTINRLLQDHLTDLLANEDFYEDLTPGQVNKVKKAIAKYQGRLEKLQRTLVKSLTA